MDEQASLMSLGVSDKAATSCLPLPASREGHLCESKTVEADSPDWALQGTEWAWVLSKHPAHAPGK